MGKDVHSGMLLRRQFLQVLAAAGVGGCTVSDLIVPVARAKESAEGLGDLLRPLVDCLKYHSSPRKLAFLGPGPVFRFYRLKSID